MIFINFEEKTHKIEKLLKITQTFLNPIKLNKTIKMIQYLCTQCKN